MVRVLIKLKYFPFKFGALSNPISLGSLLILHTNGVVSTAVKNRAWELYSCVQVASLSPHAYNKWMGRDAYCLVRRVSQSRPKVLSCACCTTTCILLSHVTENGREHYISATEGSVGDGEYPMNLEEGLDNHSFGLPAFVHDALYYLTYLIFNRYYVPTLKHELDNKCDKGHNLINPSVETHTCFLCSVMFLSLSRQCSKLSI